MEIKGAIFDMDGTLLESMGVWHTLRHRALIALGVQPKEDFLEAVKGMNAQQQMEYIKKEYNTDFSAVGMDELINQCLTEFYRKEAGLKEGILEFLELLKQQGIPMVVASATNLPLVEIALEAQGIRHYFTEIYTCPTVGHNKHEPYIYECSMERIGCSKENVVVFEDALYAIRTCKKAGFVVAGMKDAYEAAQDEVKAVSDVYFDAYSPAVLEKLKQL